MKPPARQYRVAHRRRRKASAELFRAGSACRRLDPGTCEYMNAELHLSVSLNNAAIRPENLKNNQETGGIQGIRALGGFPVSRGYQFNSDLK